MKIIYKYIVALGILLFNLEITYCQNIISFPDNPRGNRAKQIFNEYNSKYKTLLDRAKHIDAQNAYLYGTNIGVAGQVSSICSNQFAWEISSEFFKYARGNLKNTQMELFENSLYKKYRYASAMVSRYELTTKKYGS